MIDGDHVAVHFADYFRRPLRMTPDQALAIVATGRSLSSLPGTDPDGPLSRAIAKVADVLGVDPSTVEVDLGEATAATLDLLRRAVDDHRQVELDYYSYGRDELTHRSVDPHRVYADQGQWYLEAYCHLTDDERIFRVDRIRAATLLDATFEAPADVPVARPVPSRRRHATGDARPHAGTPDGSSSSTRSSRPRSSTDGGLRVRLAISARPWLERLLVRLGPDAGRRGGTRARRRRARRRGPDVGPLSLKESPDPRSEPPGRSSSLQQAVPPAPRDHPVTGDTDECPRR